MSLWTKNGPDSMMHPVHGSSWHSEPPVPLRPKQAWRSFRLTWLFLLAGLFISAGWLWAVSLRNTVFPFLFQQGLRGPAGHAAPIHLDTRWEIAKNPSTATAPFWEPLNLHQQTRSKDRLAPSKEYWLRHRFVLPHSYSAPAVFLGTLPGPYRVYLNEHLIGGAEHSGTLAAFALDPRLLRVGEENELLIKAYARFPTIHAIRWNPRTPPSLGELPQIAASARLSWVLSELSHWVGWALSAGLAIAGFVLSMLAGMARTAPSSEPWLEVALASSLSALGLWSTDPVLSSVLALSHQTLLISLCALLGSAVLLSATFSASRAQAAALAIAIVFGSAASILQGSTDLVYEDLDQRFRWLLATNAACVLASLLFFRSSQNGQDRKKQQEATKQPANILAGFFLIIHLSMNLVSFSQGLGVTPHWLFSISPLAFAAITVAAAAAKRLMLLPQQQPSLSVLRKEHLETKKAA